MIYVLTNNAEPEIIEDMEFNSVEELFVYICKYLNITLEHTSYAVLKLDEDTIVMLRALPTKIKGGKNGG